MACSQTLLNIGYDCHTSMGGILEAYACVWKEGIFTVTYTGATGEEIPVDVSGIDSGITWNVYQFRKGTGSMTSTLNVDDANGINYVSTDTVLQFSRMETQKRLSMATLALGGIALVVKDANLNYWALGVSEPVNATAGAGQTGTAKTDGNFYNITLQDNYSTFPLALTEDAVAALKAHLAE